MAEIFKQDNESYKIDVPKEKRYLNTTSYDYSVSCLWSKCGGSNSGPHGPEPIPDSFCHHFPSS